MRISEAVLGPDTMLLVNACAELPVSIAMC